MTDMPWRLEIATRILAGQLAGKNHIELTGFHVRNSLDAANLLVDMYCDDEAKRRAANPPPPPPAPGKDY